MNRRAVEELLWLLVLVLLDALLLKLLVDGTVTVFLSPRMVPFVWFALSALAALTLNQLGSVCKTLAGDPGHAGESIRLYSFVFLIPIYLAFTAMPDAFSAQKLDNRAVDIAGAALGQTAGDALHDMPVPGKESQRAAAGGLAAMEPCLIAETAIPEGGGGIRDDFADYLYRDPSELDGSQMTVCGYVYKDDAFPENTILVSRLMINCCAADASIVGFHVRVANSDDFVQNEWVQATGIAEAVRMDIGGTFYELPVIKGGAVCRIDAFETPYIYP